MTCRGLWLISVVLLLILGTTACSEATVLRTTPQPIAATAVPSEKTTNPVAQPTTVLPPASSQDVGMAKCPVAQPLTGNTQLAARVNGQGISLEFYNRLTVQAQTAFAQQANKGALGQEELKSLQQQVLEQLIDDVIIEQAAAKEVPPLSMSDVDLNARVAQVAQGPSGAEKLDDYLERTHLTLADFCGQIRSSFLREAMLARVTAAVPTKADQVHVRQILVSTLELAQKLDAELRGGADFGALARQYSIDEASRANGGELGWVARGRFDPQLESVAFQVPAGQISGIVQTYSGFHILRIDEHEKSRPLPAKFVQDERERYFLTWLQAVRQGIEIERFVQP